MTSYPISAHPPRELPQDTHTPLAVAPAHNMAVAAASRWGNTRAVAVPAADMRTSAAVAARIASAPLARDTGPSQREQAGAGLDERTC